MKLAIIGDTHDNIANIKHVMGFAKKIKAGAIIHTGDWNSLKSYEVIKSCGIKTYGVLGNADISPEIRSKLKDFLELEIDGIKIAVIHNIKDLKKNKNVFDFIFAGHLHKQKKFGNVYYPGSLEYDINFAIFDTKTKMVKFIHE